jgi:AhpD family alkylhydroperoxidase
MPYSLFHDNDDIWRNLYKVLDTTLCKGIYNSNSFGRKEREYLFSYVSDLNNCDFCKLSHGQLATDLGFSLSTFDNNIILCTDELYNLSGLIDSSALATKYNIQSRLVEQIKYIICVANYINSYVCMRVSNDYPPHLTMSSGPAPKFGYYMPKYSTRYSV